MCIRRYTVFQPPDTEAAEGNEKWGSKSELLTNSGSVKRRMWTAYSKKWGSTDPLDRVAPRPLSGYSCHTKIVVHLVLLAVALTVPIPLASTMERWPS